ncbi:MAG: histone deacetylase [Rhizobiaceae bacterium]|nr:histone deacetylase [Rhizobiaceae bacterium]
MLTIAHHPAYDAGFPPDHRFPMRKYSALMDVLARDGVLERARLITPSMPDADVLSAAHDTAYVAQVFAAAIDPAIEKMIGFPVTRAVADRALLATSGTVMAAEAALTHGLALNTAGGSHHARRAHGAGFCTLNDVAIAARHLIATGRASSVLIVDCDVHQGDGTAEMLGDLEAVFTLSLHGAGNYPPVKERSSLDVALPDGADDATYLAALEAALDAALQRFRPDFVFYNAGVDVHADDRLGRLALSDDGIAARDTHVLSRFVRMGVPLCGVIGGGYSRDIDALAARHALLFRAALGLA